MPIPAISRPPLMASRLDSAATSTSSGTSPTRATSVPSAMVEVDGGQRAEQRGRRQGRAAGLAHRPQVVEAEHPVDAERLGPAGGVEGGVGLVPELRKGDPDLRMGAADVARGAAAAVTPSTRPGPSGRGGRST